MIIEYIHISKHKEQNDLCHTIAMQRIKKETMHCDYYKKLINFVGDTKFQQ